MIQFADTIAMFPTPIATVKHDPENDWEIESMALKNSPLRPQQPGPEQHSQSEDSYILERAGMRKLKNYLEAQASDFAQNWLGQAQKLAITQSWTNANLPNESTHLHHHPNSIVSGVFYIDVGDGGVIRFHKPKPPMGLFWHYEPEQDPELMEKTPYAWEWVDVKVETGMVLLFPSYLQHSVPANQSNKTRWSLAFNTVPKEFLGHQNNLTEFRYKVQQR